MESKNMSKQELMIKQSSLFKEFIIAWRKSNTRVEMFQKFHHINDKAKKLGV